MIGSIPLSLPPRGLILEKRPTNMSVWFRDDGFQIFHLPRVLLSSSFGRYEGANDTFVSWSEMV